MLDTIKQLEKVIDRIRYGEEIERIPHKEYVQLKKDRVQLCRRLNDRLYEIYDTLNFAYANPEHRLPYKQYKALCAQRQEIRQALKNAKWTNTFE